MCSDYSQEVTACFTSTSVTNLAGKRLAVDAIVKSLDPLKSTWLESDLQQMVFVMSLDPLKNTCLKTICNRRRREASCHLLATDT
jgi:hypothetical protein